MRIDTHDRQNVADAGTWILCPGGQILVHVFLNEGPSLCVRMMDIDASHDCAQDLLALTLGRPNSACYFGMHALHPNDLGDGLILVYIYSDSAISP